MQCPPSTGRCGELLRVSNAMQPLRLVLPSQSADIISKVSPVLKSSTGWDIDPTYMLGDSIGDAVLNQVRRRTDLERGVGRGR